ncbi:hypothetical protein ACPA0O_19835 [Ectopseudomonas chengduensis]|nr:hypothetical protein [Pseudomonas sp. WS 5019]NMY17099.1 hypothetical protein [Pseudomonas sp. WS 5019]
MQTRQTDQSSNAPLAFSLSLRSPAARQTLNNNVIHSSSQVAGIALSTMAGCIACAALLYLWLPLWLCVPFAALAGKPCLRFARNYFEGGYVNGRIQSNRSMLLTMIDAQDVTRFSEITAEIAATHYPSGKWMPLANALLEQPDADHYLYIATVFSFAPECWNLSTRQVYARLLAEVSPAN